jgi:hypothetical protein
MSMAMRTGMRRLHCDDRLQQPVHGNRLGQLVELLSLEAVARVEPLLDLDLCKGHGALLCLRDGLRGTRPPP